MDYLPRVWWKDKGKDKETTIRNLINKVKKKAKNLYTDFVTLWYNEDIN